MGVRHKWELVSQCISLPILCRLLASLVAAVYVFIIPLHLYAATSMLNKDLFIQTVSEDTLWKSPEEIDTINSFLLFKTLLLQLFKHIICFNKSTVFTMILCVDKFTPIYNNFRTEAEIQKWHNCISVHHCLQKKCVVLVRHSRCISC